jgi:teichuronic acid biosynthesis glycosyltransferase TuaC
LKVLFVSSGNGKEGLSPVIKSQGESLFYQGVQVEFFTIKGKGLLSYLRHIFILRKYLKTNSFDLIHAHYSFTSYIAALAGANPLVVSLMGSDVISYKYARPLIFFFHKYFWNRTIVKSKDMYQCLGLNEIEIIPNGVNLNRFIPLGKKNCQDKLGWDSEKNHIIFAADPRRQEKNFSLTKKSMELIESRYEIALHILKNISHEDIPIYMNAADILILTSTHEGSPNVIKEAMACNCPIVATNVGDVEWLLGNTDGCFITSFKPDDIAEKIEKALEFGQRTNGRNRIIELGLDAECVAVKIVDLYKEVLKSYNL